ncbi:DDE-domain-containing protein [Histomonas meleagridis]|uniref:DDE-domain-containing protein n=1 Tax=Histomonas meleagridis TaxID=135588 RepID=UPI00355A075C|nr:DDE-domain-containing protein [Histomonas meleagridis]KAH0798283.1 DDE-domain-containing protein [Histomonas meleagridis]
MNQDYEELEASLEFGIPPEFIINIDESGYQEWANARNLQCIVPIGYPNIAVRIPRDRTSKRATMLNGICANGSTIKPMIVLSRETIEKELLDHGYTLDRVHIGRCDTDYINQKLFLQWVKQSFIPEMRANRAWFHYDGTMIIIMDGFGVHFCDQFRKILLTDDIHPLLFAPHSSNQTQFVDLLIFGLQKAKMQQIRINNQFNPQTQQVIKILDSWQRVTTPINVIAAFRRGGLIIQQRRLVSRVDRSHAKFR